MFKQYSKNKQNMKNPKLILFLVLIMLVSSACDVLQEISGELDQGSTELSREEIRAGLTEALEIGIDRAVSDASVKDGFYENSRIYVPFPPAAQKVKETALDFGLDEQVETFEKTLNRAAENAAANVKPIFMAALREMSIQEARRILHGEENAATQYFKSKTKSELQAICYPEIEKATNQVQLTKYWEPMIKVYNKARIISGDPEINPDLNAYVTEKTIDGLFILIAEEEKQIRENPQKRVTELLKKVFGSVR